MALLLSGAKSWRGEFVGVFDCERTLVSSTEEGRVARVFVEAGERVEAGQIVAQLETSLLDAEIRENAQKQRERADEQAFRELVWVQELEHRLTEVELELASDEAELSVLNTELERLEDLLNRSLVDSERYAQVAARKARLEASIKVGYEQLNTITERFEAAKERGRQREEWAWAEEAERRSMSVLSNREGVVAAIYKREGEVAQMGEPLAEILHPNSTFVAGFLPVQDAEKIELGLSVEVFSQSNREKLLKGTVISLAPSAAAAMERSRMLFGASSSGIPFTVALESTEGFVFGEPVRIRIPPSGVWESLRSNWNNLSF